MPSKAQLNQIAVLELTMRLVEGLERRAEEDQPLDDGVTMILRAMRTGINRCSSSIGVDLDALSAKDAKRFLRLFKSLEDSINTLFPSDSINILAYINGLLIRVEMIANYINDAARKWDWEQLHWYLMQLYERVDPDLEATEQMDVGEQFAKTVAERGSGSLSNR